jgi:hypothetical protein
MSSSASICVPCFTYNNCYTGINTVGIPGLTVGNIGSICNTTWANGTGGAGNGYSFSPTPNTVNINTGGIEMAAGSDIKIGDRSLLAFMKTMEERLAILVPDPAKMEKFAALKKAYEHYKTMESLCFNEPKEEK